MFVGEYSQLCLLGDLIKEPHACPIAILNLKARLNGENYMLAGCDEAEL